MPLEFSIGNVIHTEFGVGREGDSGLVFSLVPVAPEVKLALQEMVDATWQAMQDTDRLEKYQPSEKHGSREYLYLECGNELEITLRQLYESRNLPIDATTLNDPNDIVCYFARFVDDGDRHLVALRRASQFKGVLKKRLVRVDDDTLRIVEDKVFKLDSDFDLLIDSEQTHIWRPSAFEFVGGLKQAILDAVPTNVSEIQRDLPFVEFEGIERFASTHSRAARYLASIRTQDLAGIAPAALISLCSSTDVQIEQLDGRVKVADPHVMGFLEVLDRRRYQLELVPGEHERFRATSRQKIPSA